MTFDDIARVIGYITIAFWVIGIILWIVTIAFVGKTAAKTEAFIVVEKFLRPESMTVYGHGTSLKHM